MKAGVEKTPPQWHAIEVKEVVARLESQESGLDHDEAEQRLQRFGPNHLPTARPRSPWIRFLAQFRDVLIYVLLAATLASALLAHWADAGVILGVVVINAFIGFIQEGKAEKALNALRQMLSHKAMVLRGGRREEIPAEDLVPGDVVLLQAGDKVPADLRLVQVRNLQVDEAALTGESVPVEKECGLRPPEAVLADRANMAYSGTLVTFGQAKGVVTATGQATEIGRISAMLREVSQLETPLLRQMARFGRILTIWIAFLAAATFLLGFLLRGYSASEMFFAAIGLSVAAIPEGLPAIITITLAIGVQRMAQRNAIIRRLPAVETLGSVSVICSDKTGTLTRNEMTVKSVVTAERNYQVSGVGYDPHGGFSVESEEIRAEDDPLLQEIARAGSLCNDASVSERDGRWSVAGDPTEGALVTLGLKSVLDMHLLHDRFPRVDTIPFESEHRFMATLHHDHAGHDFVLVKGAPERIFEMCSHQRMQGEDLPIELPWWHEQVQRTAAEGQRTLAIAAAPCSQATTELRFEDVEAGLTLLGIVGLIDPPREEAVKAVKTCQSAGIRVVMITGDHALTAAAIANQMGIGESRVLTGKELAGMDDEALREGARNTNVFARTTPEDKLRLVRALQTEQQTVAMTGDGVNDAPALRRADVGVAMGINGTEVAKEAAEMVLADDNFASIANAVEEGRTVYDNIKKAILFILPTNGAEALTIIAAITMGTVLPITPLQILWINMITAVTLALALAFEPAEQDVMKRPPRPREEPLLSAFLLWRIVFVALLMVAGTFSLFLWQQAQGDEVEAARAVAVNALVMFEAFYLLNSRRIKASVLSPEGLFGNRYVLIAIALVSGFQLLFTYTSPMQSLFAVAAIDVAAWGRILLLGLLIFLIVELEKFFTRQYHARGHQR